VQGSSVEMSALFTRSGEGLRRDDGFPPHHERFAAKGIDLVALLSGERS
jgi:pilus assembly protein CpaF